MIASFFYESTIKNINSNELFRLEESYVCYVLLKELIDKKIALDETYLHDYVEETYDVNVNYQRFVSFLNKNFDFRFWYHQGNVYNAFANQIDAYDRTISFVNELDGLSQCSELFLINKLNNHLPYYLFSVPDAAKYVFAILYCKKAFTKEEILAKYFDLLLLKDDYYIKIDMIRCDIDESYYNLPINMIINNKMIQELLFTNSINNIIDLVNSSVETIMTLLSPDINDCIKKLSSLNGNMKDDFLYKIDELSRALMPKEKQVVSLRYGFTQEPMTLEAIGRTYGVTREYIRQLEKRAVEKMHKLFIDQSFQVYTMFSNVGASCQNYYIFDNLIDYVETNQRLNFLKFILQNSLFEIKYDETLNLVYDSSVISIDDLFDEIANTYGNTIMLNDYDKLDSLEKKLVGFTYRLWRSKVWLRKGVYEKDLILDVVDELFPDGYAITNEESANMIIDEFERRYGFHTSYDYSRSIAGLIDREDYCLINKGVYKRRSKCSKLTEELKNAILDFIVQNGPIVHYLSIYYMFTSELNELGINNKYYMKGVLDPCLPEEFVTQRTYLSTSVNCVGSHESIIQFARSCDGVFTIDDLRRKFPGIADYTLYGALFHEDAHGLLWLSYRTFAYIKKTTFSEEVKGELKDFITSLFVSLQSDVISADKVFARLSLTNRSLLKKLIFVSDSFSMFSTIKHLFKNDYGFNRPLICLDINSKTNLTSMLVDYVSGFTSFNCLTVRNYVSKMNIRRIISYIAFMENISGTFVQTNVDSMTRKDSFAISDLELEQIDNLIDLMIERFESIDTRVFNGYLMFPKLKYRWNKFLLAGIVRSYFSDKYFVEHTSTNYEKTDFIIRRLSC